MGSVPGRGWGQRVAQSRHDARDAAQQALEAGAEVGPCASSAVAAWRLRPPQVAQEVAVGLVVLGQLAVCREASPHLQVDSAVALAESPPPAEGVEVRLVERGPR